MGVTSGAESDSPSGVPELTPGIYIYIYWKVSVSQMTMVMFYLS